MNRISLYAPLNTTSYGYVSSYFFVELLKRFRVDYFPIGQISPERSFLSKLQSSFNVEAEFSPNSPCLKIWHQHDLATFIGKGKHIGFPIFELDGFTPREKNHLESPDSLVVCSQWAAEMIKKHTSFDGDVSIVPLGVDRDIFADTPTKDGPTIFGNFGKWEIRKGHDVLMQAFNLAFSEADEVELWMMPKNHFLRPDQEASWINYYKGSKLGSKIKLFDRVETQSEVYKVMSQIDCGVFPARAEGWNLEALECLSCGKHLIITDVTAHQEYCTPDNSYLIGLNGMETAYDGVFFSGQGNWAAWDTKSVQILADKMREVHELKKSGGFQLNTSGIETAKKFSWESAGEKLMDKLRYDN